VHLGKGHVVRRAALLSLFFAPLINGLGLSRLSEGHFGKFLYEGFQLTDLLVLGDDCFPKHFELFADNVLVEAELALCFLEGEEGACTFLTVGLESVVALFLLALQGRLAAFL
jgi:hypothetical protein